MIGLWAENSREWRRWLLSGAIVITMHGGIAAGMVIWNEPDDDGSDPTSALVVDLAPMPISPEVSPADIPPGPEQMQAEASVQQTAQKVDDAPEEKVDTQEVTEQQPELAPAENPDVVLAQPPKPDQNIPTPDLNETPAPATTAPQVLPVDRGEVAAAPVVAPAVVSNQNAIPNWKRQIVTQLERNKRYPAAAQARNEKGTAQLVFSLDRQGRVTSSRIVRSSGSSILDQETLALVHRAQPFPPPPPAMSGEQFELTVPVRFNIR